MPDYNIVVGISLFYAVLVCAAIGGLLLLCIAYYSLVRVFVTIVDAIERYTMRFSKNRVDSYVKQEVGLAYSQAEAICAALAEKYRINECDHMMHAANECLAGVRRIRAGESDV